MTDRRPNFYRLVWLATGAIFLWLCVSTTQPAGPPHVLAVQAS